MNSVHPENFQALNFINVAIKRHTVGTNIILEHLSSSVTLDDEREMRRERESTWGNFSPAASINHMEQIYGLLSNITSNTVAMKKQNGCVVGGL